MQAAGSRQPQKPTTMATMMTKPEKRGGFSSNPGSGNPFAKTAPSGAAGRHSTSSTSTALIPSGVSRPALGATGRGSERAPLAKHRESLFGMRTSQLPQLGGTAQRTAKRGATHTKASDDPDAEVVGIGPERDSVPFRLCCEALAQGCVQTYMHLFELAHRDPVCVDTLSRKYFTIPDARLTWVQQRLSAVEVLRRQSEFTQVLDHCHQLANYFEGEGDYSEAMRHHERAMQYMMESLDNLLEKDARRAFALFQERQGHFEEAAELFETMYRLAVVMKDVEALEEASQYLVRVHQQLGNKMKFTDPVAAARHYALAAEAAERAKNGLEEGAAYSALGDVSEARGDLPLALRYHRNYRDIAKRELLRPQECHATLRVAELEERLGLKLEASTTLHDALNLAKELGAPRQLCTATLQLGELYQSRGHEDQALQCFDESFAAALETGDQELIDKVRIAMGFARGDYYLTHAYNGEGYLHLVSTDIRAQLAWMSGGTL